ncbi:hypothetical protein [Microbulbifer sp. YPW16]|uniref:hypothetical protein n=1 Tax=Microbulbifer sp. YPW16 TaxID=2904242 RepID=UPI001E5DF0B0|nr:hypothetical protein [Microbulbifer sp. YPW16]UHQ55337.1 hypothetical protein LVE68_17800 [Microbulbifer sp. YPW16]
MPVASNPRDPIPERMPFGLRDYIALVDWGGRWLREDQCGAINSKLPSTPGRLQIDPWHWRYLNRHFESRFKSLAGSAHGVRRTSEQLGKRWSLKHPRLRALSFTARDLALHT